ncbi:hypothetical protein GCM10011505_38020 [Tistrella bauzanensis]|uniref:Phytoene synthase n=1 Tax=Tistrella bauzanensis TaxID=657419 RepID=A0ABQ1IVB2_9PROT|nr:squalene/phytoene synthase family protein [Tistrella bauzanensis]GGB53363.1 hypothetical protein GCM10011505_38020 [Tistrella bauzanensis]
MPADANPLPRPVQPAPARADIATRTLAAGREDFPVLSWAAPPGPARPAIHAFYRAARRLDDIADDQTLPAATRIAAIDAFRGGLTPDAAPQILTRDAGDSASPEARELGRLARDAAAALRAADISVQTLADLAEASRRDVDGFRPQDWADLDAHCRLSAAPVARVLMQAAGDHDQRRGRAADDLAVALQLLNHLRDLGRDYRTAGRVWIPGRWLADAGLGVAVLGAPAAPPRLGAAIGRMLDAIDELLARAASLPMETPFRRLRIQAGLTLRIARRHRRRFTGADPLAGMVRPRRRDWLGAILGTAFAELYPGSTSGRTAIGGSSFSMAVRLMPADRRPAMLALYGFSRMVDDIADGVDATDIRRLRLDLIDDRLLAMASGQLPAAHPAMDAAEDATIGTAVISHGLPATALRMIIAGCRSDCLDGAAFAPTWPALLRYVDRVAGAVGQAALPVFDVPGDRGHHYAQQLGRALQFVNILRDLDEDAVRGRIYLPAEAIIAAGVDPRLPAVEIIEGPARRPAATALARAARAAFAAADAALPPEPALRRRLRPAMAMGDAYRGLLAVLEATGFDSIDQPTRRRLKRRAMRVAVVHAVNARLGR